MSATLARLVRQVRRRVDPEANAGDCALLERWIDNADQHAFELLLWRHGPMVWQTCRRVLRHEQDAEDAFQAAFLALARKASSIRKTPSVAGWLYRVAHRAALAARSRPRADFRDDLDEVASARPDSAFLRGCLDEELRRLPDRYREAFVLCCLQGLSTDEAAEVLGCPRGTVGTRVAWARRKLRERLGRELPATLPGGLVPASLTEAALKTVGGHASPPIAELCREVLTMLFVSKMKSALTWLVPLLVVAVGLGGLQVTSPAHAEKPKPAEEQKPRPKPDEKKPTKPKPDDKKPEAADVIGVVKSVKEKGKLLTITLKKGKNTDEQTVELKLTDKTQLLFSGVGPGGAEVKEGYAVTAWFEEKSKDTAARANFSGDKQGDKTAKPSLSGPISSVADDGKSFTITVKKNKNEDTAVTVKITDKTETTFQFVGAGEAKLAKDLTAVVWLADGSEDQAARVTVSGKAEVPSKKGGEAVAHNGVVAEVSRDGKSVTISEGGKKGEEAKKVTLKLDRDSKQVFAGVTVGGARLQVGQHASIWVKADAKDTVSVALFQAAPSKLKPGTGGLAGKVTAVADDGKSFTLKTGGKKDDEGKEVTIKLADKARLIFDAVGPGEARITKGQTARVELAAKSKDTAAAVTFGGAK